MTTKRHRQEEDTELDRARDEEDVAVLRRQFEIDWVHLSAG